MKTAIERWAYQRTLSVDDFESLQELYDWATDVHDYAAQLEELHEIFEDQSTKHILLLIASDLTETHAPAEIKRARANWLIRFVKALGGE